MSTEIEKISEWFISAKAPDLKDKIIAGLKKITDGELLEENYKKLFGFMLFSYSMNIGPSSFMLAEKEAERIGVTEEFKEWAKNWISHSNKSKNQLNP